MNIINFYYLISILYEVKNTFGEQHTYVFKTKKVNDLIENTCNKKFHVSPFIDMNCKYYFRVLNPQNKLSVVINQSDDEGKLLYASQDGFKEKLSSKNLIFSYLSHPLMTLKIWLKGIKFVKKKIKIKNNITFETK